MLLRTERKARMGSGMEDGPVLRIMNFGGLNTGDGTKWWIVTVIREVNALIQGKKGKGE